MSIDVIPPAVATLAALIDVRWRKIPNWLTLSALIGGLVIQCWRAGVMGIPIALGGAVLGFAVLFPFYLIRAIGGGDVKLLAGLGALIGPRTLVSVVIYAALVGGAMSVVILARRGELLRAFRGIVTRPTRMVRSGVRAPYAVALASGVYLSMLLPSVIG